MKSIFLLASLCLFALATSAAVTTAPSTHTLGLIRVTEALLLKEAEAQLKIYVIVPRNGEKLKVKNSFQLQSCSTNYYFHLSHLSHLSGSCPSMTPSWRTPATSE